MLGVQADFSESAGFVKKFSDSVEGSIDLKRADEDSNQDLFPQTARSKVARTGEAVVVGSAAQIADEQIE